MTTRKEYSNIRDLTYSNWHREIGNIFCVLNIDWIEYRWKNNIPNIVAIIEDKDYRANIKRWNEKQKPIFMQIANALNIPAYLVLHNCQETHNRTQWRFNVYDLKTNQFKAMNEENYKKFIQNL